MSNLSPALTPYLSRYAEPLAAAYARDVQTPYEQALVIPLYDEDEHALNQVLKQVDHLSTLVIAVVNAPDNAPVDARQRTLSLLESLRKQQLANALIIDCVNDPLPHKAGVGLARKLGTDVALTLVDQGLIRRPWIYQTDADAVLPNNYFSYSLPQQGAVVFGHRHTSTDPQLAQAAAMYDTHMAYYVWGLASAGSPYAYPTLGSTMVVHAHSYAAARGYPKRSAGEDFYLLNKVAKIDGVTHLPDVELDLAARLSSRVPFGTGPGLNKILNLLQADRSGTQYLSYHPKSFGLLHSAHAYLSNFANDQHVPRSPEQDLLDALRFDRVKSTIKAQYKTPARRLQVLAQWFDGGKTLRFIHAARKLFADQPLLESLALIPPEAAITLRKSWPDHTKV